MPMPIDEKKRGAVVSIIMKKLKGSNDYDSMKEEVMKPKKMEDGAEVEYSENGYDSAVEEMMSALEAKNSKGFKSALKAFITLCMNEQN